MSTWPDYFPENCPPKEAVRRELIVYRLVSAHGPSAADFVSGVLLPENTAARKTACRDFALSVYTDLKHAKRLLKSQRATRPMGIAVGTIRMESGVIEASPSNAFRSHHSWWLHEGIDPSSDFRMVDLD